MPFRRPRRRSAALLAATALVGLVAVGGCSGSDSAGADAGGGSSSANPYADRSGYADPDSRTSLAAAQAKSDGDTDQESVFSKLAAIPQGIWLTPEQYPAGKVGPFVAKVVAAADAADQVPTFVIYGIPDRDCSGGFSGGGLPAAQYGPWVQEIADAAGKGDDDAAIVEPDALASALECNQRGQRISLIAGAVKSLDGAGVTTYVDGGHSNWVEPAQLAQLLKDVGVADARGFATNVSNYQTDHDEHVYAEKLSSLLGGAHYVIDSGRSGNGSTPDWCNPPGRAFGTPPGVTTGQGHQDAFLWVKPPGESDGECNGGPAAGEFWASHTMDLASASGW